MEEKENTTNTSVTENPSAINATPEAVQVSEEKKPKKKKKKITASDADIKLTDSYSPTLAKVEALNQERDRHLQELYEVVTKINV